MVLKLEAEHAILGEWDTEILASLTARATTAQEMIEKVHSVLWTSWTGGKNSRKLADSP